MCVYVYAQTCNLFTILRLQSTVANAFFLSNKPNNGVLLLEGCGDWITDPDILNDGYIVNINIQHTADNNVRM